MKAKKTANFGHTKQANVKKDDVGIGKLVKISDGHRVSNIVTARTDCGILMKGWRYGTDKEVTCGDCK